jgi:chemotaxis protein CheD
MAETLHRVAGPDVLVRPVSETLTRAGRRVTVGIGELAVSNDSDEVVVTHALGSCVAVCVSDDVAGVAGLVHVLLPHSSINPERAGVQPAAFADTGIPLLFRTAYQMGLLKSRCRVRLVGGADVTSIGGGDASVGKRNIQAARQMLWKNGVLIQKEAVGGREPRTVAIDVRDGRVRVSTGRETVCEL